MCNPDYFDKLKYQAIYWYLIVASAPIALK